MDERTNNYNEAMAEASNDIKAVKDRIYTGGYEFGLESTGLTHDHDLFGKVVLCPLGAFVLSSSSESEEEDEENVEVLAPAPPAPLIV